MSTTSTAETPPSTVPECRVRWWWRRRKPVILAGEPTAPLDSERALTVIRILNEMAQRFGTAIITRIGGGTMIKSGAGKDPPAPAPMPEQGRPPKGAS